MEKQKRKQTYLNAEIELLLLSASDVIATSGGFNWGSSTGGGNDDSDGWT